MNILINIQGKTQFGKVFLSNPVCNDWKRARCQPALSMGGGEASNGVVEEPSPDEGGEQGRDGLPDLQTGIAQGEGEGQTPTDRQAQQEAVQKGVDQGHLGMA